MSYCRFIECDVYAYDSVDGGVQFYVARSVGEDLDRLCPTYNEAYQYAKTLRDKHGVDIPDHAIYALRADALEEAERISGPGSAVDELRDENARLRELMRSAVRCIADVPDCDSCALGEQVSEVWVCHLIDAAKKLGIEVSE